MKHTKILSLMLTLLLLSLVFVTGCGSSKKSEEPEEPADLSVSETVNIAALNGPTGLGMVGLMDDKDSYNVKVYQAPTDAMPDIIKGDVDVACVPSNLAAVLYNKTKGQIVSVSPMVMGILHILSNNEEIKTLEELKGKTIISSGQGGTPEYALQAVLKAHGIEMGKDVKVEWLASHSDVNTKLLSKEGTIAMVPEPFVSTALTKGGDKIKDLFDMNTLWAEATSQDFPMAVLIARKDFVENRENDLNVLLKALKESIDEVNTASDEVAQKIVDAGFIGDPEIAKKAIPNCSLCLYSDTEGDNSFEKGAEIMKTFNKTMFDVTPAAVGGALPDDALYYTPSK